MVLETWNQNVPLFARSTFVSAYKSGRRGVHECLRVNKKSCSIFWSLFGVLEVKDGLDRKIDYYTLSRKNLFYVNNV